MRSMTLSRPVAGFLVLAAAGVAGWFGRWEIIEPEGLAAACAAGQGGAPLACLVRPYLVQLTFSGSFGITAVVAAALAWLAGGRLATALALLALVAGGLGMFLFDADWAVSGAVAALLRLARPERAAPEGVEAGTGAG